MSYLRTLDEVLGVIKEIIKDVKDSFTFYGMSTCGKGFFAELDGKREDYIYLCTPVTDQALVCDQGTKYLNDKANQ